MRYEAESIEQIKSIYEMISLKGKKAVITGGAGGIARAVSVAFAELGADVALLDIPAAEEELKKNCEYLEKTYKVTAVPVIGDVSDEASVTQAFGAIEETLGTVDIVFSNAGITCTGMDDAEITLDTWKRMLDVNLTGMLLVDRAGAELMKKHGHGGSIINTASMSAHIINRRPAMTSQPGYTTSKAGVRQLTRALAISYVESGIRVNSISPGYVMSGLHQGVKAEVLNYNVSMVPIKRFASLDEVVGAVVYLASDMSTYCIGTDLIFDGGYTVW